MNIMQLAEEHKACPDCGALPGQKCVRIYEAKYVPKWPYNPDPHQSRMDEIRKDVYLGTPEQRERWLDFPFSAIDLADIRPEMGGERSNHE